MDVAHVEAARGVGGIVGVLEHEIADRLAADHRHEQAVAAPESVAAHGRGGDGAMRMAVLSAQRPHHARDGGRVGHGRAADAERRFLSH